MSAARVAFSPDLPFIVTGSNFRYRGQAYAKSSPFPWRELGLDVQEVLLLWRGLQLDCLLPQDDIGPKVEELRSVQPPKHYGKHRRRHP